MGRSRYSPVITSDVNCNDIYIRGNTYVMTSLARCKPCLCHYTSPIPAINAQNAQTNGQSAGILTH